MRPHETLIAHLVASIKRGEDLPILAVLRDDVVVPVDDFDGSDAAHHAICIESREHGIIYAASGGGRRLAVIADASGLTVTGLIDTEAVADGDPHLTDHDIWHLVGLPT